MSAFENHNHSRHVPIKNDRQPHVPITGKINEQPASSPGTNAKMMDNNTRCFTDLARTKNIQAPPATAHGDSEESESSSNEFPPSAPKNANNASEHKITSTRTASNNENGIETTQSGDKRANGNLSAPSGPGKCKRPRMMSIVTSRPHNVSNGSSSNQQDPMVTNNDSKRKGCSSSRSGSIASPPHKIPRLSNESISNSKESVSTVRATVNEKCRCDLCLICDGYNIPNTCTGRLSSRRCDI